MSIEELKKLDIESLAKHAQEGWDLANTRTRELTAAREKISVMNRRCQDAESAAATKVEEVLRAGPSLGRGLANWAASDKERKVKALELQLSEAREGFARFLLEQIPGLEARESHDGGPSLRSLMQELAEKVVRDGGPPEKRVDGDDKGREAIEVLRSLIRAKNPELVADSGSGGSYEDDLRFIAKHLGIAEKKECEHDWAWKEKQFPGGVHQVCVKCGISGDDRSVPGQRNS